MTINSAYILATQAEKLNPGPDMEYRGGYFFFKTCINFWLFPVAWFLTSSIDIQELTSGGTVHHYPSSYTSYPNGWGLLYFGGKLANWWDNPPRDGSGVFTKKIDDSGDYRGAAAYYVFETRDAALACLNEGKKTGIKEASGWNNCFIRIRMRSYGSGVTYYRFENTNGTITYNPAVNSNTPYLSNIEASTWNTYDQNGTFRIPKNING